MSHVIWRIHSGRVRILNGNLRETLYGMVWYGKCRFM